MLVKVKVCQKFRGFGDSRLQVVLVFVVNVYRGAKREALQTAG